MNIPMESEIRVPIFIPSLPTYSSLKQSFEEIDESHIYSNFGPKSSELASIARSLSGFSFVETCANATLALEGAFATAENPSDEEWCLPSWTFTATASALLRTGKRATFVDIDENWCANFTEADSSRVLVLPFGSEPNVEEYNSWNGRVVSNLIIDAAASFQYLHNFKNLKVDYPIAVIVSLHATKSLPAGEGALFLTNSVVWAQRFKSWCNFGMNGDRESQFVGTNAKMSEYHAAIALSSLSEIEVQTSKILSQRRKAAELSRNFNLTDAPPMTSSLHAPYWLISHVSAVEKENFEEFMHSHGVATRDWWGHGCHKMPAFKGVPSRQLPRTTHAAETSTGLPFFGDMTDMHWQIIEDALNSWFNSK